MLDEKLTSATEMYEVRLKNLERLQVEQLKEWKELVVVIAEIAESLKRNTCDVVSIRESHERLVVLERDVKDVVVKINGNTERNSKIIIAILSATTTFLLGHFTKDILPKQPTQTDIGNIRFIANGY